MVTTLFTVPGAASALSTISVTQIVLLVFLGLLGVLGLIVMIFGAVVFGIARLGGDAAPRTRQLLSRLAQAHGGDALHHESDVADLDEVSAGLAAIKARDPQFDQVAIVEAAYRALFFTFVMQTTGEAERLEQVTTDKFWRSAVGVAVRRQAVAQNQIRANRQHENVESTRSQTQPEVIGDDATRRGTTIIFDFHPGPATVVSVQADEGGLDRVTLRLGYVGRSAYTGRLAEIQLAAQTKSLSQIGHDGGGLSLGSKTPCAVAQSEQRGWYDWQFVRSSASQTSVGGEGRRCHQCGAPFRSDLDTSCPNCRQPRVTPEGEWRLERGWLVVTH